MPSSFTIGAKELGESHEIDFSDFISIVKGRSIVSGADWGADRIELGLSGGAMLRCFRTDDGMQFNVISTTNVDEIPPVALSLGDIAQRVPISVIERKLRGLRTLYAIYLLSQTGRLKDIESYLIKHPYGDIERALLGTDEALHIESLSFGSWMVVLWAETKQAYRALSSVGGLIFERGREAYLAKLEAEARLAHARARREELAAATDEFNLRKSQLDYFLDVTSRVSIPEVKDNLERQMIAAVRDVVSGDPIDGQSYKKIGSQK